MKFNEIIKFIRKRSLLSQSALCRSAWCFFFQPSINGKNGKSIPQIGMLKRINEFCLEIKIPVDVTNLICPETINETQISIKEAE